MKKDIMIDLKRLGLHNGSEFISSAFPFSDFCPTHVIFLCIVLFVI